MNDSSRAGRAYFVMICNVRIVEVEAGGPPAAVGCRLFFIFLEVVSWSVLSVLFVLEG